MKHNPAPEWQISRWFNTTEPPSVRSLRGRVILVHAFQMLCPGCVARGIPQAVRVYEAFRDSPLSVIGIHTVFEHHDAMTPTALHAFIQEYRIPFPVGVDRLEGSDGIPLTMKAYGMRGTPTSILIDAEGRIRHQVFGAHDDLRLGAELQALLSERETIATVRATDRVGERNDECGSGTCTAQRRQLG